MDFRKFDRARRSSTAVEIDHIEAFAQGRISRRQFVARGSVLGLSVPLMASVISACGSSATKKTGGAVATGKLKAGGILKVANHKLCHGDLLQ